MSNWYREEKVEMLESVKRRVVRGGSDNDKDKTIMGALLAGILSFRMRQLARKTVGRTVLNGY